MMLRLLLLVVCMELLNVSTDAQLSNDMDELLNWCIQGIHHKTDPGPEAALYSQCTPWKDRSCCTDNTTRNIHNPKVNLYNFDFNHCGVEMSPSCRRHFMQDLCFYECSPNVGPWVVKVEMKTRKERFFGVPLCESDCEAWFDSCRTDLTCTSNWMRNFDWSGGKNRCHKEAACQTFEQVFQTAQHFCEKVWDGSWKVLPDKQACMRLWFDASKGNPNDKVARLRAGEIVLANSAALVGSIPALIFVAAFIPLVSVSST